MNVLDAAKLLTVSSALTGREPTEDQAMAWSMVLDDITLDEAMPALRAHYAESRFPVMPADIVAHVKTARDALIREERREVTLRRQRAENAQHRILLEADGYSLRDSDVLWPDVGWGDENVSRG